MQILGQDPICSTHHPALTSTIPVCLAAHALRTDPHDATKLRVVTPLPENTPAPVREALRFDDGEQRPLILAHLSTTNVDGGDGGCAVADDGYERGE